MNANSAAGISPPSVAVHPSGRFAYAGNCGDGPWGDGSPSGDVSIYTINSTTGVLTSIGKAVSGPGVCPAVVAIHPAGKLAYAANAQSKNMSIYTVNGTTGALTSIGTIAAGLFLSSIAIDLSSKFASVANSGSNDISIYSTDSDRRLDAHRDDGHMKNEHNNASRKLPLKSSCASRATSRGRMKLVLRGAQQFSR